jgi:hypothetical protein
MKKTKTKPRASGINNRNESDSADSFLDGYNAGFTAGEHSTWSRAIHAVGVHRYDQGMSVKQFKRLITKVLRGLRDAQTTTTKGRKR